MVQNAPKCCAKLCWYCCLHRMPKAKDEKVIKVLGMAAKGKDLRVAFDRFQPDCTWRNVRK